MSDDETMKSIDLSQNKYLGEKGHILPDYKYEVTPVTIVAIMYVSFINAMKI